MTGRLWVWVVVVVVVFDGRPGGGVVEGADGEDVELACPEFDGPEQPAIINPVTATTALTMAFFTETLLLRWDPDRCGSLARMTWARSTGFEGRAPRGTLILIVRCVEDFDDPERGARRERGPLFGATPASILSDRD